MGGSARVVIVAQERREVRERKGFYRGAGAPSVQVSIVRVLWHQRRPSASSQRQHTSSVTKRIVKTAAHIAGTTDVSIPAGVALYATAASRLRAPKLEALPAFHVKCSSLTPAGGGRGRGGARSAARRGFIVAQERRA